MTNAIETGAQALVQTLADQGIRICFANPGTSEMHLVAALDGVPEMRSVLCLFEGVVSGAADGYGRVAGKPAMTLLHLGSGLTNAAANLHNAKRAHTPIVNIVGDHARDHRALDAPLTSDIDSIARACSSWTGEVASASDAANAAQRVICAATQSHRGPATLTLPADCAWLPVKVADPTEPLEAPQAKPVDIAAIASAIRGHANPCLFLSGDACSAAGVFQAGRIAAAGVRVMCATFVPLIARGASHYPVERLIYHSELATAQMADIDLVVLAGATVPVAFFAYPDKPSHILSPHCETRVLSAPGQACIDALRQLADALDAPAAPMSTVERQLPAPPQGALSPMTIGASLSRWIPDNAIVSDDSVSAGLALYPATTHAASHDWLMLTGGAIGQGLPLALGAAIAAPDRHVIALTGDGAGMYTLQALWSMAREQTDVTIVVLANRAYTILNVEWMRMQLGTPGSAAADMFNLSKPDIAWAALATSMGVPAQTVSTAEDFDAALRDAAQRKGPYLIEAVIATEVKNQGNT
jgi:acetolactate synthase I/II/III large subunit